jgi:hypothetical protein
MTTHWVFRLRSFGAEAPTTLLAQHDLLQLLVDSGSDAVQLTIRVAATRRRSEIDVAFYLLCEGAKGSGPLAKTLHDVAAVGLLPGYSITTSRDARPVNGFGGFEIRPHLRAGESLPIKPDWSQVFDLVRRRGDELTLDLRCSRNPTPIEEGLRKPPLILGTDEGTPALEALSAADGDGQPLILSIVATGPKPLDRAFLLAIGRKIFGVPCETRAIKDDSDVEGIGTSATEALRAWHWPYGDIQGRGLGKFSPSLPLVMNHVPRRGVSLGEARAEGPRFDRDRDVVMTQADRV